MNHHYFPAVSIHNYIWASFNFFHPICRNSLILSVQRVGDLFLPLLSSHELILTELFQSDIIKVSYMGYLLSLHICDSDRDFEPNTKHDSFHTFFGFLKLNSWCFGQYECRIIYMFQKLLFKVTMKFCFWICDKVDRQCLRK